MTEIIDYLLIFWVALAVVVYILGSILEAQERSSNNKKAKQKHKPTEEEWRTSTRQHETQANRYDDWPPYANQSTILTQQQCDLKQYSAPSPGQANRFSTNDHFEQPTSTHNFKGFQNDPSAQIGHFDYGYLSQNTTNDYPYSSIIDQNSYRQQCDQAAQVALSRQQVAPIPTATGFNPSWVEWVNSVLYLFFSQADKYSPIIAECICRSLNERLSSRSTSEHADLIIEFNGINRPSSSRPELTNIRTESETDRSVSVTCKIYNKKVSFNLSIRPRNSSNVVNFNNNNNNNENNSNEYELILENLEGKLKSLAMLNEKLLVIQFIEKPDTKILLKPRHTSNVYNTSLINEDVLVQMILQTLTQVMVDLYFGEDVDFPRFKATPATTTSGHSTYSNYKNKFNTILRGSASELKKQIKHDFFGALSAADKERKVFIKIVRAKNINYNQNVTCLLELDSPHQQAISSTKQGSSNPYWDEHFLFNVNEKSKELLLELWDSINLQGLIDSQLGSSTATKKLLKGLSQPIKKWNKNELCRGAKFLGLVGINMDELRKNPVQKVDLILEPMETPCNLSNSVGGELQVELLFLEHSASPVVEDANRSPSPDGRLRKSQSASSLSYQHGDIVSIDRKLTPSGYVITTTTITKPNQQANAKLQPEQQQQQHLSTNQRNQSPISSSLAEHTSLDDVNMDGISCSQVGDVLQQQQRRNDLTGSPSGASGPTDARSEAPSGSAGRLSRSRSRSRSFLRAIKKRFSFSRTRSRSVGESGFARSTGGAGDQSAGLASNLDAISIESHSRASSEVSMSGGPGGRGAGLGPDGSGRAKSVPTSRDPNEVPTIVINKGRLSDTASAFTFTHPKSQLVIEVMEPTLREDGSGNTNKNGRLRYYAIAEGAPNKRKWAKRGVKLHLFNEHQFVACHLAGSSTCHLCGRVFSRRPGKQGYKCRNCHLLSHKQCHVKVDHNCPYAKREGLPLEYIDAEPPASLMDEVAGGGGGAPSTQANQQEEVRTKGAMRRMTAKSISMEVDDR